jgi:hypothetical protein
MQPVALSIDFGSAYTKVALRRACDQPSDLVSVPTLNLDELHVCVPSVVAVDRSGAVPRWDFGLDAVDLQDGAAVTVFRNWKPALFADSAPVPAVRRQPVSRKVAVSQFAGHGNDLFGAALLEARQEKAILLEELAELTGLAVEDVRQIAARHCHSLERLREEVERLRGTEAPSSETAPVVTEVREAALEFFRRLRDFITPACRAAAVADPGDLPVRVCVPAFRPADAGTTPADQRLLELLREAGWQSDENHPIVTEPYANAVGTLTNGANVVHFPNGRKWPRIHLGRMFGWGSLVQAWRTRDPAEYVVLVIDIGAYTTDFAALHFDACDDGVPPQIGTRSVPLGVTDLEETVKRALSPAAADWFAGLPLRRREEVKRLLLTLGQPVRVPVIGTVGMGAEAERVREAVGAFSRRVAGEADQFLAAEGSPVIQDLILTGGGNNIPGVRLALTNHLKGTCKRIHSPGSSSLGKRDGYQIEQRLVRGASALGAASIYFDELV